MKRATTGKVDFARVGLHGWAGRLVSRLRAKARPQPRLALLERITLAPRQSLALVEAEGRRFLVASSAEGAPAFYALEERRLRSDPGHISFAPIRRVSW